MPLSIIRFLGQNLCTFVPRSLRKGYLGEETLLPSRVLRFHSLGWIGMYGANTIAFAILNRASTNPSVKEAEDARTALADYEHLRPAQAVIRDRISFRKAAREGSTVGELADRDAKAIAEIQVLYKEVFGG